MRICEWSRAPVNVNVIVFACVGDVFAAIREYEDGFHVQIHTNLIRVLIKIVKVGRIRTQIKAPRSQDQIRTKPADFVHTP